jgi:multicomponent Na+:H+ antiporter subunit G
MGPVFALAGAALTLLASIGVVRFPDVLARMHALTKASTVGFVLVLTGGAVTIDNLNDVTTLVLAAALQVLTMPVAANLMSRSTYMARGITSHVDGIDELAEHLARTTAGDDRGNDPADDPADDPLDDAADDPVAPGGTDE